MVLRYFDLRKLWSYKNFLVVIFYLFITCIKIKISQKINQKVHIIFLRGRCILAYDVSVVYTCNLVKNCFALDDSLNIYIRITKILNRIGRNLCVVVS